jgi:hypothetical protein
VVADSAAVAVASVAVDTLAAVASAAADTLAAVVATEVAAVTGKT